MRLSLLDPRVKLILLLAISTVSVTAGRPIVLAAVLVLVLVVLLLGGVHLRNALRRIRGMVGLICLLFLIQCVFTRSGEAVLTIGGFPLVTSGGLTAAALVALRLLIILLSAVIILTGESRDYLLALNQWHIPYEISFMVLVALRFIPILREEARDVLCAVQMRGTPLKKTSLRHKLSVYVHILLPIVSGAIRRSEQTSIAMEARAFRSNPRRTNMRRLHMKSRDWLYLAGFTLILGGIVCLPLLFPL